MLELQIEKEERTEADRQNPSSRLINQTFYILYFKPENDHKIPTRGG